MGDLHLSFTNFTFVWTNACNLKTIYGGEIKIVIVVVVVGIPLYFPLLKSILMLWHPSVSGDNGICAVYQSVVELQRLLTVQSNSGAAGLVAVAAGVDSAWLCGC